jgi:hypothetical protein
MMNHKARRARTGLAFGTVTGLFLGLAALFSASATEGAASTVSKVSICETGFPSDPDYAAECMRDGTREDAAVLWYFGYSDAQRTADCRTGRRTGDLIGVVRETRGDVITDNFRNGEQMIRWTARMGVADCESLGFGDVR